MNLQEVFALSKEKIDRNICYINHVEQDKFMAHSFSKNNSVVNQYVFKITKDNELKIIDEN